MAETRPAEKISECNGLSIHYLDWGNANAQPLILLHGIARVAQAFDHLAPHFADRYHVMAVDMRGHGESGWHSEGAYLVEDYASDIEVLIEQLGLRNCVLWGASTGGRAAQMIAGCHPEWVAAAIIEDVGPERPAAVSNRRGARMATEENGWASVDELLAHVAVSQPRTAQPILRHLVEHGSKVRSDGRIVWKRDPAILKGFIPTELWDAVCRIKAPVLYVLGGLSNIVPPETQAKLKQVLPQAQIVTLPGLGHYPSDEKPEEFLAVVDRFLMVQ